MKKITIFTPTYNRMNLLKNVYSFLCEEEYENLEWIIVDDGSTDNTKEVVDTFKNIGTLNIKYYWQRNKGKHVAYNLAIEKAAGDVFICIDSDDIYEKGSLTNLINYWTEMEDDNCSGVCYLSRYRNGQLIGTEFPKNDLDSNLIDIYYKHNVKGDKGIMFNTKILKKFRFPQFADEKFLTESVLYAMIGLQYNMKFINSIYEIKEYQEGGLSDKYRNLMFENPKGALLNYQLISKYKVRGYLKYKNEVQLSRFIFINRENWFESFQEQNYSLSYFLLTPLGWILSKAKFK